MAEYIAPIIDGVIAVLEARCPEFTAPRDPIREFGKVFRGVVENAPEVFVTPKGTSFNPEGTVTDEAHEIEVTVAVTGMDADELVEDAMFYVRAVSQALMSAPLVEFWPGADPSSQGVRRVYVADHDYGSLMQGSSGFGAFPRLSLVVEVSEL